MLRRLKWGALLAAIFVLLPLLLFKGPWWIAGDYLQRTTRVQAGALITGFRTALVTLVVGTIAGLQLYYAQSNHRLAQQASERRLNDAEQALEEALRRPRVPGDVTITGDVNVRETPVEAALTASLESPPVPGLRLPELWTATHARLDHYHHIATGQAQRSFLNAQVASGVGFALLIIFVCVALSASTTTGSIVAGALGAVSAALAGFVSRTFVRSQETSASHLRSYFDQPLELSRFLAAERLIVDADLSENQRAEILATLVQAMVAGTVQPPQDQNPSQR